MPDQTQPNQPEQPQQPVTIYTFQLPPGVLVAWGARAICASNGRGLGHYLDVVHDRTKAVGADEHAADYDALSRWLAATGLKELRRRVADDDAFLTDPRSDAVTEIRSDGFVLMASPRSSYGYIYIAAWPEPRPAEEPAARPPAAAESRVIDHNSVRDAGRYDHVNSPHREP